MEELIEILINLIGGLIDRGMKKQVAPKAMRPAVRNEPPPVPAVVKKPAARKPGRRPALQSVTVAQPIVTATATHIATASTGTAHAVPAKSISDSAAPNAKASVGADSLRRWLTPTTLRQQFMLTEILQPPLALRQSSNPGSQQEK